MAASGNRRDGIDSRIVQASTVRGYDVTGIGNIPLDLILTPGKNVDNLAVSTIYFSNRTDQIEPLFVLAPGANYGLASKFEVLAVDIPDPNGLVTSPLGSLVLSNNPPALWQNQDGALFWKKISDDLGGETLAETLLIGNTSGITDIVMSKVAGPSVAARVRGESSSDGTNAGPLLLGAGDSTGPSGNGGNLVATSGDSLTGNTGNVLISSFNSTNLGGTSGFAAFTTGIADGNTGAIGIATGNAGRDAGALTLVSGNSATTNAGPILIQAGNGPLSAGSLTLRSGTPTAGNTVGAPLSAFAGNGFGAGIGGPVSLRGGNGGPGGGNGGSIFLTCGPGGGGADKGQIIGDGVFLADNYRFGAGSPNALGVSAREGSLYQNTAGGQGEIWANTNGSPIGWQKLAFAADFINSFSRLQYGTVTPALNNLGGADDDYSDSGLYEGVVVLNVGGTQSRTVDSKGPVINLTTPVAGAQIGWSVAANTSALRREHRFVAVFKIANTSDNSRQRISIGMSTASLPTHLGVDEPGGEYVTLTKKDNANSWTFLTRGPGGPQSQGLGSITLSLDNVRYVVFDFTDPTQIIFKFLDDSFTVLEQKSATGVFIPQTNSNLYPICGVRQQDVTPVGLKFYVANVITEADEILNAGNAISNQTLQQVLQTGNETGGSDIIFTDGDSLYGENDAKAPGGGDLVISSGGVTTVTGDTGLISISSRTLGVPLSSGNTGAMVLATGSQAVGSSTGDTGLLTLSSGFNNGSGESGGVILSTGQTLGGGDVGDLTVVVGFDLVSTGAAGTLSLRGGKTSKAGAAGGPIIIQAGNSFNPSGGDGGAVSIFTGIGDTTADTDGGRLNVRTGAGAGLGNGGPIAIASGAGGVSGVSGTLSIRSADSVATTGSVELYSGDAALAGEVDVRVGNSSVGNGVRLLLKGGDGAVGGGGFIGGPVIIEPGMGDEPGLITLKGFVDYDAPAFKYGRVSLNGQVTDVNGDLTLTWGAGPLVIYTAFPFGVVAVSLVSFYDTSYLAHVRCTSTNSVSLTLRFYNAAGAALSLTAFGANSFLSFQTYVHN